MFVVKHVQTATKTGRTDPQTTRKHDDDGRRGNAGQLHATSLVRTAETGEQKKLQPVRRRRPLQTRLRLVHGRQPTVISCPRPIPASVDPQTFQRLSGRPNFLWRRHNDDFGANLAPREYSGVLPAIFNKMRNVDILSHTSITWKFSEVCELTVIVARRTAVSLAPVDTNCRGSCSPKMVSHKRKGCSAKQLYQLRVKPPLCGGGSINKRRSTTF